MRKRTKKIFKDYNDYHDRGFMKWATAYAMDELMKEIEKNHHEALKDISLLPQMTEKEIDDILSLSYFKDQPIKIQLNKKNVFGRPLEFIEGAFEGTFHKSQFIVEEQQVYWEDIRNVQLVENNKWYNNSVSEIADKKTEEALLADTIRKEIVLEKNEFDQTGTWSEWIKPNIVLTHILDGRDEDAIDYIG